MKVGLPLNVNSFAAPAFTSLISLYCSLNDNRRLFVFSDIILTYDITSPVKNSRDHGGIATELKYRFSGHCPLSCYATARLSHSATTTPSHSSDSSSKNFADLYAKSSHTKSRFECAFATHMGHFFQTTFFDVSRHSEHPDMNSSIFFPRPNNASSMRTQNWKRILYPYRYVY